MKKFLYMELQRLKENIALFAVLFIGTALAVSQLFAMVLPCVDYLDHYMTLPTIGTATPFNWYIKWIGGECHSSQSFLYFLLIPLFATIPLGASLLKDRKNKYTVNLYIRGERKNYYKAKLITTFLCGAFAVTIPLLINMFLSMAFLPSNLPEYISGLSPIMKGAMFDELFYTYPDLYELIYMTIIFVYGGVTATFSLALGTVIENTFLCVVAPFTVHLFMYAVFTTTELAKFSPFMYLSPAQRAGWFLRLDTIIIEYAAVLLVSVCLLWLAWKKDETI